MKFGKGEKENEFRRKIIEAGAIPMHSAALILTHQGAFKRGINQGEWVSFRVNLAH